MIKWPITYTDYNDETVTEDFYFNLNRAEVLDMDISANGAYVAYLQGIVDKRDGKQLAEVFKHLILASYGEKSADGRRFVKSKELSDAFSQTEAYVELYMQLATDPESCRKFVQGIMPKVDSDNNPKIENHMTVV